MSVQRKKQAVAVLLRVNLAKILAVYNCGFWRVVKVSQSTPRAMIRALSDSYVLMERENWALRKLLHTLGQSDASIQRKVAVYLQSEDYRQAALHSMRVMCEETIKRLPESDAEDLLAELPIKGPHQ